MNDKFARVLAAAIGCAALPACGSNHDAASRQLVAITHLSSEPAGTLSITDDSTYTYLTSSAKTQTNGSLSSAEFKTLTSRLGELDALYAEHAAQDSSMCSRLDDGYLLSSKSGSACFITSSVSDPARRSTLDYFVGLYNQRATTTR